MKYIGGTYVFLLLFVNLLWIENNISSAEELEPIDSVLARDVYNPSSSEFPIAQAVVPIFNQATSIRGTAFFISPNRLVTNFHVVCCFKSPVNENLSITTKEGKKVKVDKLIYASAYYDLSILEIKNFSSEYFLSLNKENDMEIQDDILSFGYTSKAQDIIRLKGKIVDEDEDIYGTTLNFYKLSGFSGSPVISGRSENKVAGIIFLAVRNIAYIIPALKLIEVMNTPDCSDPYSCQANAFRFLLDQAESGDAKAQFMLYSFLKDNRKREKNFEYFLEKDILADYYKLNILYLSAEAGYSHSQVEYGRNLINTGVERDYIASGDYFLDASNQNNILGHFFMAAWLLEKMNKSTRDNEYLSLRDQVISYFKQSAEVGHLESQFLLGRIFYNIYKKSRRNYGLNFESRTTYREKALEWLRRAGNENNDPEAGKLLLKILTD